MKTLAILLTLSAAPAWAVQCAPYDQMTAALAQSFGESVASVGVQSDGSRVVTYANPATGTWTAMIVQSDRQACIVATGTDYTQFMREPNV